MAADLAWGAGLTGRAHAMPVCKARNRAMPIPIVPRSGCRWYVRRLEMTRATAHLSSSTLFLWASLLCGQLWHVRTIQCNACMTSWSCAVLSCKVLLFNTQPKKRINGTCMWSDSDFLLNVPLYACAMLFADYSFQYAPNQTPFRDQIFIKLLTGISQDENFKVNAVYFSIFNIIGIYTFVYQCLLIPAGRSANRIPAWPFVVLSYALGAFALLPYMALWSPIQDMELPPKKEELEGWNKLAMKGAETAVLPGVALVASVYLLYNALSADNATWQGESLGGPCGTKSTPFCVPTV
eukprot:366028-Chlamydomonas_euryale.AAC.13